MSPEGTVPWRSGNTSTGRLRRSARCSSLLEAELVRLLTQIRNGVRVGECGASRGQGGDAFVAETGDQDGVDGFGHREEPTHPSPVRDGVRLAQEHSGGFELAELTERHRCRAHGAGHRGEISDAYPLFGRVRTRVERRAPFT